MRTRRQFIKRNGLLVPAAVLGFPAIIRAAHPALRSRALRIPPPAAGGAGPFTFIASALGFLSGTGTTVNTSTALNLAAGDLVIAWCGWQTAEAGNTAAIDESDGTDAFTNSTYSILNDNKAGFSYLLNAPADASFTVRVTVPSSNRIELQVLQFRPTTAPATLHASTTPATGTSVTPTSAAITTTIAASVVLGGANHSSGAGFATPLIGGVAATKVDGTGGYGSIWYRILSATVTGATAVITAGANDDWVCGAIAFA